MEDLGMDSVQLLDSDDEDFSAQSSVADGEVDAYSQEEKEISDDFELSCENLHNLFIDSNLEALTTLEEASNHEEQSVTEETGKNKKIFKSLFQETKNGKVRRAKGEGGFKGESKLHRGTISFNEDN
ncbi:hypothetical protein COP1_041159 [Malus domestica]